MIHITLSGDIFLKSRRTQPAMIRRVRSSLEQAVAEARCEAPLVRLGSHRFALASDVASPDAIERLTRVFGVASVDEMIELDARDVDHLAGEVARYSGDRVAGCTFAVRVKRRGSHEWRSHDLAVKSGTLLVASGGTCLLYTSDAADDN